MKCLRNKMRKFEFPYNFDKKIIDFLKCLDPKGVTIDCIYLPPYLKDYNTILRTAEQANFLNKLSRDEYENHLFYINKNFPNKIQLLLQKEDKILSSDLIQYYMSLGISKFCVATIEQAKIIKQINSQAIVVGSISMQISKEKILNNFFEYNKFFNGFVLTFKDTKRLDYLKSLPQNFYYILLINAYCNIKCSGKQHWNHSYKNSDSEIKCPGILSFDNSLITWEQSARIRPMDLGFFDPYISIYKLQDRGWPTDQIIRDYILYTSNYSIYPNIFYDKNLYNMEI